ncbi:MAG TPA: hypothetical protein VMH04_14930 [Candidatus Solibacter sp.]|nr:hypothetical protein [Candidatus Solibacter sp.]
MHDAWHILKWIYAVVLGGYIVVQIFAARRLKGNLKKRSNAVLTAMVLLMGASEAIRDIFFFENRMANRAGMVFVGFAALVAIVVLVRAFGENPTLFDEAESDEGRIQSLKLS